MYLGPALGHRRGSGSARSDRGDNWARQARSGLTGREGTGTWAARHRRSGRAHGRCSPRMCRPPLPGWTRASQQLALWPPGNPHPPGTCPAAAACEHRRELPPPRAAGQPTAGGPERQRDRERGPRCTPPGLQPGLLHSALRSWADLVGSRLGHRRGRRAAALMGRLHGRRVLCNLACHPRRTSGRGTSAGFPGSSRV